MTEQPLPTDPFRRSDNQEELSPKPFVAPRFLERTADDLPETTATERDRVAERFNSIGNDTQLNHAQEVRLRSFDPEDLDQTQSELTLFLQHGEVRWTCRVTNNTQLQTRPELHIPANRGLRKISFTQTAPGQPGEVRVDYYTDEYGTVRRWDATDPWVGHPKPFTPPELSDEDREAINKAKQQGTNALFKAAAEATSDIADATRRAMAEHDEVIANAEFELQLGHNGRAIDTNELNMVDDFLSQGGWKTIGNNLFTAKNNPPTV